MHAERVGVVSVFRAEHARNLPRPPQMSEVKEPMYWLDEHGKGVCPWCMKEIQVFPVIRKVTSAG